jgi:uncharacterized RmlC-like cupin family protein
VTALEPEVRILEDGALDAGLVRGFFDQRLAAITHLPEGASGDRPSSLTIPPAGRTVAHDHGRHETLVHVLSGNGKVLWGQQLEHSARIGPGTSVLIPAGVFHQEINESAHDEFQLVFFGDADSCDDLASAGAHQLAP